MNAVTPLTGYVAGYEGSASAWSVLLQSLLKSAVFQLFECQHSADLQLSWIESHRQQMIAKAAATHRMRAALLHWPLQIDSAFNLCGT